VLRAHPERHVLAPGVRVVGNVPVTARRAQVAAGQREPLGGIGVLLADHRPLDADIPVIEIDGGAEAPVFPDDTPDLQLARWR